MAITERKPGSETQPDTMPIALFIDDYQAFYSLWESCFQDTSLSSRFAPLDEKRVPGFLNSLSDQEISRLSFIVCHQGSNSTSVSTFLDKVQQLNSDVLIIETSGLPRNTQRPNSFPLHSFDVATLASILENTPSLPLKMAKLKYYLHPEAIQTQSADPNSEWSKRTYRNFSIPSSRIELFEHPLFSQLAHLLGMKRKRLISCYYRDSDSVDSDLLHLSWNILLHLKLESERENYQNSVNRLRTLLDLD